MPAVLRHSLGTVPFSSEHEGPQVEEDAPVPVTPALGRLGRFHKLNASLGCTVSSCLRTECGEAPLCNASIREIETGGQPGLFETLSQKKKKGAQVEIVPNGKGSFNRWKAAVRECRFGAARTLAS